MANNNPINFLSPTSNPKRPLNLMAPTVTTVTLNGTAASKRAKQPSPPGARAIPSGHVALRVLCHASLVGGFIGRSGAAIKQLQSDTLSRIRVEEDPLPPGSPLRVISVVAESAPARALRVGDEELRVSAAQEAVVRVFEKLLEVSREVEGPAANETTSCRLLVDAARAGSVIGKGGKVVERIRRESGAKIRVLLGNQLPPGVSSPHELVEIEGDVLAVKKALIGVCGRLQECTHVEKPSAKENRLLASTSQPAVPIMHVDPSVQFRPVSGATNSSSPGVVGRPLSLEADGLPLSDPTSKQQEVVFKILCSTDITGGVIGRGGSIVRALQDETGASISVGPTLANCDERLITITSKEDMDSKYSPAQRAVVLVFSRSVEAGAERRIDKGPNNSSSITARLVVPSNQVGCLLGKGGAIVSEMRKATGAGISIFRGDQVPKCASEDDEVVEISGQFVNVQDALYQVTSKLRNNLFPKVTNVHGNRMGASVKLENSLFDKIRDTSDIGLHIPSGRPGSFGGQAAVRQGLDSLMLHRFDHSSSPSSRSSEIASGVNPRTYLNQERVLASANCGVELGSVHRPPIVTNTTVEILVPESAVSSVYGENGSNLARIRQISGANVIVHEPRAGSIDRTVVISGTPDETQAAQSLLHAFILTGPS